MPHIISHLLIVLITSRKIKSQQWTILCPWISESAQWLFMSPIHKSLLGDKVCIMYFDINRWTRGIKWTARLKWIALISLTMATTPNTCSVLLRLGLSCFFLFYKTISIIWHSSPEWGRMSVDKNFFSPPPFHAKHFHLSFHDSPSLFVSINTEAPIWIWLHIPLFIKAWINMTGSFVWGLFKMAQRGNLVTVIGSS